MLRRNPKYLAPIASALLGACSLINHTAEFADAGDAQTNPADSGLDAGADTGPPEHDAGLDAQVSLDAGGECADSSMCAEPTPFCGDTNTCVACLDNTHCADTDPCTVDRCSLGTCTHLPGSACASVLRAGGNHACALRDGRALCWGQNSFGQLGDSTTMNRLTPRPVGGVTNIMEITTGFTHTCARLGTGSVLCWGSNPYGQLGDDTRIQRTTPTPVVTLANARSLSAGGNHTCAVTTENAVMCWGRNSAGQIGDGMAPDDALRPAAIVGITNVTAVAAGFAHTCVLRGEGSVSCWGSNSRGQLGNGTTSSFQPTAVDVLGITDAIQITAGTLHTCALRATGAVVCWGGNSSGQLGDGSMAMSPLPAPVPGLSDVVEIRAGALHTCAVRETGALLCWGDNATGQLGDGTMTNSGTPVLLGVADAIDVTCGSSFTCARRAADATTLEALCWGNNLSGQLGTGTMDDSPSPVAVVGL